MAFASRLRPFAALLSLGIVALAPLAGSGVEQYDVDIRWTSYGIPHIKANDYASATYGYGEADILADPNLETLHLVPEPADLRLCFGLGALLLIALRRARR